MKYPYIAYCEDVAIVPVFRGLTGNPLMVDLSAGSSMLDAVDVMEPKSFQAWLDRTMKDRHTWGLAPYLENREPIVSHYPQMRSESRYFHLGLDIIVGRGTPLHAPLNSVVQESGYEDGPGNYGGNVLLRHDSPDFETFYSLYGHLNREKLPAPGDRIAAGGVFAYIGDFYENGGWFFHTHLQVITRKGYDQGWVSKGYCSHKDLAVMDQLCPSPLFLFRR